MNKLRILLAGLIWIVATAVALGAATGALSYDVFEYVFIVLGIGYLSTRGMVVGAEVRKWWDNYDES